MTPLRVLQHPLGLNSTDKVHSRRADCGLTLRLRLPVTCHSLRFQNLALSYIRDASFSLALTHRDHP